jgi:hypothetical protein
MTNHAEILTSAGFKRRNSGNWSRLNTVGFITVSGQSYWRHIGNQVVQIQNEVMLSEVEMGRGYTLDSLQKYCETL